MEDIMHIQSSFLRGVAARAINNAIQKQGYKSTEVKLNDIFAGYSEDERPDGRCNALRLSIRCY